MIRISSTNRGHRSLEPFLQRMRRAEVFRNLDIYGRRGVDALRRGSPVDTGTMAQSWYYEIVHRNGQHIIYFGNHNEEDGVNVAIIVQFGHGTGTGAYIQGRDYINPAIQPVFDQIVEDIWRQVKNA